MDTGGSTWGWLAPPRDCPRTAEVWVGRDPTRGTNTNSSQPGPIAVSGKMSAAR